MVLTQLQLKWPNHSTHLLTGLTSLFKNEQLVDCTLKCNKRTLKVHRSVLAACSPYFERELKNNPLMVIEDMQFAVLRALVEFMYYGETHISEENLTSLIEAAKLFEVKGLSEMDLLTSAENTVISSVVEVNSKNCAVESSCISNSIVDTNFENNSQTNTSSFKSHMSQAIPNGIVENCLNDGEDSNSTLIIESANDDQSHASRNFVVTPPQAESAKILLSLAHSHSAGQYAGQYAGLQSTADVITNGGLLNGKIVDPNLNNNIIFDEQHGLVLGNLTVPSACNDPVNSFTNVVIESELQLQPPQQHQRPQHQLLHTKQSLHQNEDEFSSKVDYVLPVLERSSDGHAFDTIDVLPTNAAETPKSTLLKLLLTRSSGQSPPKCARYDEQYRCLYEEADEKNQNNAEKIKNVDLQTGNILDYSFLIQTPDGYVDITNMENMLHAFESGDIFEAGTTNGSRGSVKIIPKDDIMEPIVDERCSEAQNEGQNHEYSDAMLERIKRDTADELRSDPEAVVLNRVTEDGKLEKYILSSADIQALREMNERRRHTANIQSPPTSTIEIESSLSDGETPLITRIIDCGHVENAISKLPFKKSVEPTVSLKRHDDCEHILEDARLAVESHQHENMFEELDNQFNMDIEHIQREYVAYEEASKNETQLEHNYYANAIKDEEEECAVIGENYDLRTMAMIEEPLSVNGDPLATLGTAANGRRKNANILSTFHVIDAHDIYLKGCESDKVEELPRRNGFVEKVPTTAIFNGKCDLDGEALLNSASKALLVKTSPPARTANGSAKNYRTFKSKDSKRRATRGSLDNGNTLPFKSVKSTSQPAAEKKSRRTYKRKASAQQAATKQKSHNSSANGSSSAENSLIEEIVVDEIS